MRKLIVKLFALDTMVQIFGKKLNYVRASNMILPAFLLMVNLLMDADYPRLGIDDILSLILLGIMLFFGFVYFNFFPIKWEELDDDQKWQYGMAVSSKVLSKQPIYTAQMEAEWYEIDAIIKARSVNVKNYNVCWFIINPICVIITLLIL